MAGLHNMRLSQSSRCATVAGMTTPHTIAVLGLGRMGGAIATRLTAQGWDVVGWTRSGRTTGAVKTTGNPNEAVARADLVLLALFDGPACQQVLDDVRDSLRPDTVVLNTSTTAPAEASNLARQLDQSYVHAPVLGSVPLPPRGPCRFSPPPTKTRSTEPDRFWKPSAPCGASTTPPPPLRSS